MRQIANLNLYKCYTHLTTLYTVEDLPNTLVNRIFSQSCSSGSYLQIILSMSPQVTPDLVSIITSREALDHARGKMLGNYNKCMDTGSSIENFRLFLATCTIYILASH